MAFDINRFVRVTLAYNSGQITTSFNPSVTPALSNGPAMFTYASSADTIAQIGGANYFAEVVYDLSVNDLIFASGSDASNFYQVATVNRDAGTVTVVSVSSSGVVGTANIQNNAVTFAKMQEIATVTLLGNPTGGTTEVSEITLGAGLSFSSTTLQVNPTMLRYAAVAVSAAEFNGMYAAPKLLVAAGGANTLLVLDRVILAMTYGAAAYADGGVTHVQYSNTANGAGVIASTTLAAASFQDTASTAYSFNAGVVEYPFATTVNQGLYLSNITGAFTTGDSDMVAHVWYKVIPTV